MTNKLSLTRRGVLAGGLLSSTMVPFAATTTAQSGQHLLVYPNGIARWGRSEFRCALGAKGVSRRKREGDLCTPVGSWPLRRVLYRADRLAKPVTALPVQRLERSDGWSDDPGDPQYNRLVRLPRPMRAEVLWRNDHLYDLIVPVGYNDDPVVPGAGSAIFIHVARTDYGGTAGCVAFKRKDLLAILVEASPSTRLVVYDRET